MIDSKEIEEDRQCALERLQIVAKASRKSDDLGVAVYDQGTCVVITNLDNLEEIELTMTPHGKLQGRKSLPSGQWRQFDPSTLVLLAMAGVAE